MLAVFPRINLPTMEDGSPGAGEPKLTLTEQMIAAAISQKWPKGLPQFQTKKQRNREIFKVMAKRAEKENVPCPAEPSDETFSRYFNKVGPAR